MNPVSSVATITVPWGQRPFEVANLFNPAFCALLLRQTVHTYQKVSHQGMDYSMLFLVLPVVLHKVTRELLPPGVASKFHVWIQRHHHLRVGFAERMQNMVPITKEALLFGLQHKVLQVDEFGTLKVGPRRVKPYEKEVDAKSEAAACLKKSDFVGRWFADAGTTATILAAWGVKVY
jgi:hypothetical protein